MAVDAHPPELSEPTTDHAQRTVDETTGERLAAPRTDTGARADVARTGTTIAIMAGIGMLLALSGLAGLLGYRSYEAQRTQQQRDLLLHAGRQAALNLTTISYQHVEADVQRILDSSIGSFRDDFQRRSQPFIHVVKEAQSQTEGTITEAGLETQSGDQAQVLVAVTVKTVSAGAAEQQPRAWRMRINVHKVGDDAKADNIEFVP